MKSDDLLRAILPDVLIDNFDGRNGLNGQTLRKQYKDAECLPLLSNRFMIIRVL